MKVMKVIVDELPNRCFDCQFYIEGDTFMYCYPTYKNLYKNEVEISKPDWCPLVSIKDLAWMADSNKVLLEIESEDK